MFNLEKFIADSVTSRPESMLAFLRLVARESGTRALVSRNHVISYYVGLRDERDGRHVGRWYR